jgi:hypothetical protein
MTRVELSLFKLSFESIRNCAFEFLEQAYQTDNYEYESREKAIRLERLIYQKIIIWTKSILGTLTKDVLSGPFLEEYIHEVVFWGLHLSLVTYTGNYSIIINNYLRNGRLTVLPKKKVKIIYPELFQNKRFSEEERIYLEQKYIDEYETLKEAFVLGCTREQHNPEFFRKRDDFDLDDLDCTDLFSECYQRRLSIQVSTPTCSCPIIYQLFAERCDNGGEWDIFELPTKELIKTILESKINPITNLRYDQATIQKVRKKFPCEMKLIQRNLELLSTNTLND